MEERLILRLGSEMYTIRREYPVVPESNEVLKKKKKIHPPTMLGGGGVRGHRDQEKELSVGKAGLL